MSIDAAALARWHDDLKRIWPTSCEIGRLLDRTFQPPWPRDVRREGDDERHTIWYVPDYERGRSRSLAVERGVLRDVSFLQIAQVLDTSNWSQWIEREDLLVRRTATDKPELVSWKAPELQKWLWSQDHDEWFMAFQSSSGGSTSSEGSIPPFRYFVGIHGKSYAAVGPDGERDVTRLQLEDIRKYLPKPRS